MQTSWDRIVSGALTVAALAIAGSHVYREVGGGRAPLHGEESRRYEADWREVLPAGRLIGNPDARVNIVVFSDFQCPFCRRFHETLSQIVNKYPVEVAYTFIHFPLSTRGSAFMAAKFAECAHMVNRFELALDLLFANQDSLSTSDWEWFAREAGVQADPEFVKCMADPETPAMVERGLAAGAKAEVRGTPVVYLNGWRYPGAPPEAEFVQAIEDLIAGRAPYDGFPRTAVSARIH